MTISERVMRLLIECEPARSDDCILYAKYIKRYFPKLKHIKLVNAFENHKLHGLPSFKTISRTRQTLQVKYPELKGK